MQATFEQLLLAKTKNEPLKIFKCGRCIRWRKQGDQQGEEHGHPVKGHTLDLGSGYVSYNCFDEFEFDPEADLEYDT